MPLGDRKIFKRDRCVVCLLFCNSFVSKCFVPRSKEMIVCLNGSLITVYAIGHNLLQGGTVGAGTESDLGAKHT